MLVCTFLKCIYMLVTVSTKTRFNFLAAYFSKTCSKQFTDICVGVLVFFLKSNIESLWNCPSVHTSVRNRSSEQVFGI